MVARTPGQLGDRAARRRRFQPAAADEVEPQRENAIPRENQVPNHGRHAYPLLERREVDGTCRLFIVETLPGETGGGKFAKQRFVSPGSEQTGMHIRKSKGPKSAKDMERRTAAEGIGIEISGDNRRTRRKAFEQKFRLNAAARSSAEDFEMRIGDGERAP